MNNIYVYIFIMAAVTYLIRMLPLVLIRREIKSRFVRSFLHYVPYSTLAAMTFPAILSATASVYSALIGFIAAVFMAYRERSMITVAITASAAVFIIERFIF